MKFGLPISFSLHALAGFGGVLMWSGNLEPLPEALIIPLELVTVAEMTNIKPVNTKPKPDIKPEPIAPEPIGDTGEETLEGPDEPQKQAAFDLDAFSAMVDKAREENPDANTQKPLSSEIGEITLPSAGDGTGETIDRETYIRSKMEPCWYIDQGAQNYRKLVVKVRMLLNEQGEITAINILNNALIIASANNSWKVARDNVEQALRECAPYDGLKKLDYQGWKSIKLNFQPGDEE